MSGNEIRNSGDSGFDHQGSHNARRASPYVHILAWHTPTAKRLSSTTKIARARNAHGSEVQIARIPYLNPQMNLHGPEIKENSSRTRLRSPRSNLAPRPTDCIPNSSSVIRGITD